MTTVSTRKSSKPKTPPLPTIMTLTLNADGSATLLTKRGDLACANSFTYRDLKEIIAALKQGAAQLVELEQNPPSDAPPPRSHANPAVPIEAQSPSEVNGITGSDSPTESTIHDVSENETDGDSVDASEATNTTLLAEADDLSAGINTTLSGVIRPTNSVQMPLL